MENASSEPAWIPLHTAGYLFLLFIPLLLSSSSFWGEGNLTHVCHVVVIRSTSTHPSHSSPSSVPPATIFSEFPRVPFTNPPNPLSALTCVVEGHLLERGWPLWGHSPEEI